MKRRVTGGRFDAILRAVVHGMAASLLAISFAAPARADMTESAATQIRGLMAEKAARTPVERKIGSGLLRALRVHRGLPASVAAPQLRVDVAPEADGRVRVDVRGEIGDSLLAAIRDSGGEVTSSAPRFHTLQALLPFEALTAIAERDDVRTIRPASEPIFSATNVSEGDIAHRADLARTTFTSDGSGITVGVVSDGIGDLTTVQASGDLPPKCPATPCVRVVNGQIGVGNEGTAMMEVIHDLAPGANLKFATGRASEADQAQNILALAAAGCTIIADDTSYTTEPVFQDGPVAQAVSQVVAQGVVYVTAAGNEGNAQHGTSSVWEGDFSPGALPSALSGTGVSANKFGAQTFAVITAEPTSMTLQWSDPWGASGNDYDLYLLDSSGTVISSVSDDVQDGTGNPYETIGSHGFVDVGRRLVIVKTSAGTADRFLRLQVWSGALSPSTVGQSSGHLAARDAITVGAVDVATAGCPGLGCAPFTGGSANPVESTSSDGPRRVFYDATGTPLTPGDVSSTGGVLLIKPDVLGADGVSVATPSQSPFSGTSAAAAHVAGIAAIYRQAHPNDTPTQVARALRFTALDNEAAGVDPAGGYGIVDAVGALSILFADGFESGDVSSWDGP